MKAATDLATLHRELTKLINRATLFVSLVWLCLTFAIFAYSAWEIHGLRKQIETFCQQIIVAAEHEGFDLLKKALEELEDA